MLVRLILSTKKGFMEARPRSICQVTACRTSSRWMRSDSMFNIRTFDSGDNTKGNSTTPKSWRCASSTSEYLNFPACCSSRHSFKSSFRMPSHSFTASLWNCTAGKNCMASSSNFSPRSRILRAFQSVRQSEAAARRCSLASQRMFMKRRAFRQCLARSPCTASCVPAPSELELPSSTCTSSMESVRNCRTCPRMRSITTNGRAAYQRTRVSRGASCCNKRATRRSNERIASNPPGSPKPGCDIISKTERSFAGEAPSSVQPWSTMLSASFPRSSKLDSKASVCSSAGKASKNLSSRAASKFASSAVAGSPGRGLSAMHRQKRLP
mmetsp:Transcript_85653/g.247291  ORF Transcript_85653/g.247291 Transcript_85653/m.247291 type:complete len:325 (+) Transcript_85653:1312-2286(+)